MSNLIRLVPQAAVFPQTPAEAHLLDQQMALRDQVTKLTTQVASMDAQRVGLEKQLKDAANSPFALGKQQQLAQLEVQLAGTKAELDAARAQLKASEGIPVPGTPRPDPAPREYVTVAPPIPP